MSTSFSHSITSLKVDHFVWACRPPTHIVNWSFTGRNNWYPPSTRNGAQLNRVHVFFVTAKAAQLRRLIADVWKLEQLENQVSNPATDIQHKKTVKDASPISLSKSLSLSLAFSLFLSLHFCELITQAVTMV